jgi:hypothetical protein
MLTRLIACSALGIAALGSPVASGAHAAVAAYPAALVPATAAPPHYTLREVAVDTDSSTTQAIVSDNGHYLVNNYVDPIIWNTATGKRVGTINDVQTVATGVSNAARSSATRSATATRSRPAGRRPRSSGSAGTERWCRQTTPSPDRVQVPVR